ncbi:MAG: hypothetical protein ABIY51_00215 [Ferruginibacter sp.]
MKIILALLVVTGFLFGCDTKKDTATSKGQPVIEDHKAIEENATGLVLNNGAKWKADSTTLLNVALLHHIISGAKKETLEDYLHTSTQLEAGLNKMVTECRIKGADHEALHHWLEPLIEETKELKRVSAIKNASRIFREMETQANLFPQYFE